MKNVITKTLVASAISTAMLAGAAQADVTMVSWGGGYSASQQKAYIDTYSSGDINLISYNGGLVISQGVFFSPTGKTVKISG